MKRTVRSLRVGGLLSACCALLASPAAGSDALVAVAANFAEPARALAQAFEADTDYQLRLTVGSTGKLYAQTLSGAPFDLLLAADAKRPRLLEEGGWAVPGTRRTYALGRLALWRPGAAAAVTAASLATAGFRRLVIANPDLAPYGLAAMSTLRALGVEPTLGGRLVRGENVGQAFAMVATGNAELGFVARSQLQNADPNEYWLVPAGLHEPIRQDLVLLDHGAEGAAARAFLAFLSTSEATRLIEGFGYDVP